jgi:hypothetical protein
VWDLFVRVGSGFFVRGNACFRYRNACSSCAPQPSKPAAAEGEEGEGSAEEALPTSVMTPVEVGRR